MTKDFSPPPFSKKKPQKVREISIPQSLRGFPAYSYSFLLYYLIQPSIAETSFDLPDQVILFS